MPIKVCKFGGSSLASAAQFRKVGAIIHSDADRRFVIPSAPGRRNNEDQKVTDMLYACQSAASKGDTQLADVIFADIRSRFSEIATQLSLSNKIQDELDIVRERIANGASRDYAASRGEYLNGIILSEFLGFQFFDACKGILFNEEGIFDDEHTQHRMFDVLSEYDNAVIPGFYGCLPNGEIKTFSRGGSDITGAVVARALNADLYENWTDVCGIMMADPRIVKDPKTIPSISYRELRELSYMGASVLHEDSIFPVSNIGIPINVRNTNEPEHPGTMIVSNIAEQSPTSVTGIAGKKDFTVISIEKDKMNSMLGFGRRVLTVLERHGVLFEHLPSGIDTICVVVADAQLEGKISAVINDLNEELHPDVIDIHRGVALVATVGAGMIRRVGVSARLFKALSVAGVNIRMIDQGSSEINIIVGVENADFETALRAIYAEFSNDE